MNSNAIRVTVRSVRSNVAKIHSRLPAAMEFWLVCLGIVVSNAKAAKVISSRRLYLTYEGSYTILYLTIRLNVK